MNKTRLAFVAAAVACAAILASTLAFAAIHGPYHPDIPSQAAGQGASSSLGQSTSGTPHGPGGRGLQGGKLQACQARENGIKNRSTHLANLAKTMENIFDSIAQRVEDYYTNTVVPSGKTVANYSNLVSDISTKKTAVQTALTAAQNEASGFSCTSADPKGTIMQYNTDMRAVRSALQDYRTSIKNLIVAVHSVTGEENKNASSSENGHPNIPASSSNQGKGQ